MVGQAHRANGAHEVVWTRDALLSFGMLYFAAWGVLPTVSRLKGLWCMPDHTVVLRTFGTLSDYHTALEQYIREHE